MTDLASLHEMVLALIASETRRLSSKYDDAAVRRAHHHIEAYERVLFQINELWTIELQKEVAETMKPKPAEADEHLGRAAR